jgi:hypothetical protein
MKSLIYTLFIIPLFILSCDKDDMTDAQSEQFVKFYTTFPEFSAAYAAETGNGYAIVGTAKTLVGEGDTWICLLRTDKFGNSIDSARIYGKSEGGRTENRAFCIKALSDGGFGILGSVFSGHTGFRSVYFIRTDEKGDTLFTRTISRNGDLEAKYFDVSSNGSFYMTGYFDDPLKNHQMWWFGIDSEGRDIRNQRDFGYESDDEGNHLIILSDGRLLISGFTTETATNVKKAVVIRTNQDGLLQAPYVPSSSWENEAAECLIPINNEEFYMLTTFEDASLTQIALRRVNFSNPNSIWTKTYDSGSPENAKLILSDGQSIFILGTTFINSSNSIISLITTDLSGEEKSRLEFGSGSKLSASSFARTRDGGFIITGTNVHPEVNNTAAALIKTR